MLKKSKNSHFPKGLTHGFGAKLAIFQTFLFQAIQSRKTSFTIFQNEKTPFKAIKTRSSKSRKIHIFSKGLWFLSKNDHFSNFSFQGISARKTSFTIFQNEKTPFKAIKTRSSKSRKIHIFSKGLWFLSKNDHFSNFSFQGISARKTSFTIFQNEKTPFKAIKTRSSKSRKIDIFPKGFTHGFAPKMAIFPTFLSQAIQSKKMAFRILQNEKTPVQAIKTRNLNSRKIDIF